MFPARPSQWPKPERDPIVEELTRQISEALQGIALALDTYPKLGAITIKTEDGLFELALARSDQKSIRAENLDDSSG